DGIRDRTVTGVQTCALPIYCMPDENVRFLPRREILTFEEIERFARVAASLGVNKLRLTGGEPLVRSELPRLVERLAAIEGIYDKIGRASCRERGVGGAGVLS